MKSKEQLEEKVKKVLGMLPLADLNVEFEAHRGFKVIAVVTSKQFEKMDEGDRQHMVWAQLIDHLDPYEQTQVEFVHTMAPSEF
ncbi:MAG TPA: hypothetical protein VKA15_27855 [Isosphaeraceae bacterium]|nr:hypothetical protein [Isosphaeraceae bacterium]